eukprot:CAMPEP_0168200294 /NCGR_PEP_ID=MMETSP0139_2-20121125/22960_1 /TAXON_ID=44445 /ORGANISM="Pseudo-nitzschia australis, Strain 10249 10 AB" /LENGTH=579 /DNA_ID=CAMNT_0008125501 /DNA_START=425 /DNA_END=2164 /DNA_ORIENTATION=-
MEAPTEVSGRGDPPIQPDHSKTEITSSQQINEPAHKGGTSGDSTTEASDGYSQVIPPYETPQQSAYNRYHNNPQITPESPSPNNVNVRAPYNAGGSFFQQQSAAGFQNSPFTNEATHPYAGGPGSQPPSSPTQSMGGIPPASPLFPRMTAPVPPYLNVSRGGETGVNPGMSPVPSGYSSSSAMYVPNNTYPTLNGRPNGSSNTITTLSSNNTNEEYTAWNENGIAPYSISPAQGGMTYVPVMPPRSNRSSPFDDSILPHPSSDGLQNAYGAGPGAVAQGWGYGPTTDAYGNISNLSQGRPSGPYPGQIGGQFRHPPPHYGAPYGGHFGFPTCGTAASPGPPIQTTSSNKGPDGANLFIFHIPNHFGNFDMYNMFSPYGNLLSVRIMVEKDSGRSRGFGFVSYDNPDSAALAIKELNGFAIGNKRLKVQHKQIRPVDQHNPDMNHGMHIGGHPQHHGGGRGRGGRGAFNGRGGNNLPPSGPMSSSGWHRNTNDMNNIPCSTSTVSNDVGSGEAQNVVVVLGDGPSNSTNVATAETVVTSSVLPRKDEHQVNSDPLSQMDALGQTLPDIGAVTTTPVPSEK